ncbi:hypothetical protein [Mycobacteroides chelonae]|uniref:hypothetical protein n=1 Tax=Mycobacteroides chelonae TaxID=1774 RepID=UPI0018B0DED0|nr:hypothetical protein [Mycobacteroides chelonae]MBF9328512.1 hypothetical protein [Mycobacteroides chelonae]MBF9422690.1 hypothetical protein [Mycobacteroides chelonae]
MSKHICPVCWQRAVRTHGGDIWAHLDTVGRRCEGSGQPFRITLIVPSSGKSLQHRVEALRDRIEIRKALAA